MKLKQFKSVLYFAITAIISLGCSLGSSQEVTETGISYQFIENGTGEVPPEGGFWLLNIAFYTESDSTLFSSEDRGGTMTMNYKAEGLGKNSSVEECLSMVGEGDSAVFYFSADSLFKNTYRQPIPPEMIGTKIKLCVGVEEVFTIEEFTAHNEQLAKETIEKEQVIIKEYVEKEGINASVTEEGIYYEITEAGSGEKPLDGQSVKVNYAGYLLDGTLFDSSDEELSKEAGIYMAQRPYGPIDFTIGKGGIIKGWDIGMRLLQKGGKATLVIPSALAYGNRPMGELIKANSILMFKVELVDIAN